MSRTPAPADFDDRTPVTVMLSPAQLMRLELRLAQAREADPTADDNTVTDLIFSRGLDAAMEKPMESITPEQPQTLSKDGIDPAPLYRAGGGRFLQLGIGRNLADLLARTLKACREKSPDYAEDSLLRCALDIGLVQISAGIRDLQEYPQDADHELRAAREMIRTLRAEHEQREAQWHADIQRLTDQLEAARCQSVQAAVAVLQNAMTETGASVTIDQHPQAEVVYASGTESIRVPPAELAKVIESLECLQRYQRRCGDWDREITSLDYELLAGCRRPTTETPEV